jgi:uncharacterized protein DUF4864
VIRRQGMTRRAALARLAGALAWGGAAAFARAAEVKLGKSEWAAIKRAISQQLAALRAGDGERAFGYASPGIQAQFGDAQTFMTMVRSSYSPLLDARYTEFLEGAIINGVIVQPLRLIARDDTVLVALYTVERQGRGWRISGCQLAPSTVQAA